MPHCQTHITRVWKREEADALTQRSCVKSYHHWPLTTYDLSPPLTMSWVVSEARSVKLARTLLCEYSTQGSSALAKCQNCSPLIVSSTLFALTAAYRFLRSARQDARASRMGRWSKRKLAWCLRAHVGEGLRRHVELAVGVQLGRALQVPRYTWSICNIRCRKLKREGQPTAISRPNQVGKAFVVPAAESEPKTTSAQGVRGCSVMRTVVAADRKWFVGNAADQCCKQTGAAN